MDPAEEIVDMIFEANKKILECGEDERRKLGVKIIKKLRNMNEEEIRSMIDKFIQKCSSEDEDDSDSNLANKNLLFNIIFELFRSLI